MRSDLAFVFALVRRECYLGVQVAEKLMIHPPGAEAMIEESA